MIDVFFEIDKEEEKPEIDLHVDIAPKTEPAEEREVDVKSDISHKLKIRRSVDGDFIIYDHADIDIVVSPSRGKVIAFATKLNNEKVYDSESRLMSYLARKGIVDRASIRSGNVYSSMEAKLLSPENGVGPAKLAILLIAKFVGSERPKDMFVMDYKKKYDKSLTDPDIEDSTELGEVPHKSKKGSIDPRNTNYALQYRYNM